MLITKPVNNYKTVAVHGWVFLLQKNKRASRSVEQDIKLKTF